MKTLEDQKEVTEYAEHIVIEYANISGRETDNRAYVREAALKVLPLLIAQVRTQTLKEAEEAVGGYAHRVLVAFDGVVPFVTFGDDKEKDRMNCYQQGSIDAIKAIRSLAKE